MNKPKIIKYLKEIQKETCSPTGCPAKDYYDCKNCKIQQAIDKIIIELETP